MGRVQKHKRMSALKTFSVVTSWAAFSIIPCSVYHGHSPTHETLYWILLFNSFLYFMLNLHMHCLFFQCIVCLLWASSCSWIWKWSIPSGIWRSRGRGRQGDKYSSKYCEKECRMQWAPQSVGRTLNFGD